MLLPPSGWTPLDFGPADWTNLNVLATMNSNTVDRNYLSLVVDYISENYVRINRLYRHSDHISSVLLDNRKSLDDSFMLDLDNFDKMSLFSARLFIASNRASSDVLNQHFKTAIPSVWAKHRFIYPLLNFELNNVIDDRIDVFLGYVVNSSYDYVEKQVVKLLLRDDADSTVSSSFRMYVWLLLHPFDACEAFLNHVELAFADAGFLPPHLDAAATRVLGLIEGGRAGDLRSMLRKEPLALTGQADPRVLQHRFQLDPDVAKSLSLIVQSEDDLSVKDDLLPELVRMRRSKYPDPVDFDLAVTTFTRWRFTDAGRMLVALVEALYLLPRKSEAHERRTALRLSLYFGQLTPVILGAPSGRDLLARGLVRPTDIASTVLSVCTHTLSTPLEHSDRIWIIALHWLLHGPQRELRIGEWLATVRGYVPVAPGYLTGINWNWFDSFVEARKLKFLRGNVDACYALLLRQIEERVTDSWLRLATEPLASEKMFGEFVSVLLRNYTFDAIAFVRYFLFPDNILLMKLAPNYTAALAMRISALRECVRKFGYTSYVSEAQFDEESRTLTSALLSSSISGSRFEIAWDIFKRDVSEEERYFLETIHAIFRTNDESGLLGRARLEAPHRFPNGQTVEYEFQNREWPFVQAVLVIVDTFMQHPSVGIEVVLSTRFRHDTVRREFEKMFTDMRNLIMEGVFNNEKDRLIEQYEGPVLGAVDAWLDSRMQTKRPGRDEGLFDFAPTQKAVESMLPALAATTSPSEIVAQVCSWLAETLGRQANEAKQAFDAELRQQVRSEIQSARSKLESDQTYRSEDVAKVGDGVMTLAMQQIDSLLPWFATDAPDNRPLMTVLDVKLAADGLYESYLVAGTLFTTSRRTPEMAIRLHPQHTRLMFDLFDEVYANAIKYGHNPARVRIGFATVDGQRWLICSSTTKEMEPHAWAVTGDLYRSTSDTIFGEGSSGLGKVAALVATLRGKSSTIHAIRRPGYFHLLLPLAELNDAGAAWSEEYSS